MGIYIKGIDMPKSCGECKLRYRHQGAYVVDYCFLYMKTIDPWTFGRERNGDKPEWCPLVPVPPHDRLIDADALMDSFWNLRRSYQSLDDSQTADKIMHGVYRAEQIIHDAPTVIPADEEKEKKYVE